MTHTRVTALLLVLFAAVASFGQAGLENPRPGEELYLVVLGQGATEPDVAALGGRVLRWWSDRRVVAVSPEAAEALQSHAGVAYVQRIWTGEALETAASMRAPTEVAPTAAPPAWSTGLYEYDPSGNIKSIGSDSFAYDAAGRVIEATVQGHTETYLFDPYGNLRQLGSRALAVHEATNRLIGFGYDGVGNMTTDADGRTYHYDPLGMVTAIDVAATDTLGHDLRMIYTADDERIVVAEGTTTTRYRVRDFGARVLREWKNTGEILEWERDYLYAGGELVAGEVQVDQRQNGLRHYHKDHLGSTRMVTDGAGELVSRHDYLPFGAEIPPTTTEYANTGKGPRDPKKFTGHERDYLSVANVDGDYLDYMHARYYSPEWGRFLSVDPNVFWALQGGSDEDRARFRSYLRHPQRWNRYSYVSNNPVNRIDPDGREENFYMEQLFHEQQMVGEGKMTEDQYWARRRSEGYGALIGTVGALGWVGGVRLLTMGYGAFQSWRATSAAVGTIKAIEQVSRGDAKLFDRAMQAARASGRGDFMKHLDTLLSTVRSAIPDGQIYKLGTMNGQTVWGSTRSGIGIVQIEKVTKVVQRLEDGTWHVLGNFR